jgi:hypothetical protein
MSLYWVTCGEEKIEEQIREGSKTHEDFKTGVETLKSD